MATGAPLAIADCAREAQVATIATSPEVSICSTCAPVVHQTSMCLETLSRLLNARFRSQGYTCEVGTPSAIRASSMVSKGYLRIERRPGNSSTFQRAFHESGALRPLNASVRYASTVE